MHWIGLPCPHCGKTKAYHRIPSTRYAPAAPVAFGGVLLALIFDRSRKPQFRCESCGTVFFSHTIASRFFLLFWALFCFWMIMLLAVLILVPLYDWIADLLGL
jgi:ribosomal protein L32